MTKSKSTNQENSKPTTAEQPSVVKENTVKPVIVAQTPKTEADKIWDEIKNVRVNMFSLPNQKISNFCKQSKIEPNRCFLKYGTASSIIPAMEEALGNRYKVEIVSKYVVVSRNTDIV